MDLVTRGRLSVQRVREDAWKAIGQLAEKGGWEDMDLRPTTTKQGNDGVKHAPKKSSKSAKQKIIDKEDSETEALSSSKRKVKRKLQDTDLAAQDGLRRSSRIRRN